MKSKKIFFVSLLLFSTIFSFAQKIRGYTADEENKPLPYTVISLLQASDSVLIAMKMSDTTGYYAFDTKAGLYYLTFENLGSKITFPVFELKPNQDFVVPRQQVVVASIELDKVTLTQKKKPMIEKTSRGLTVNVKDSPVLQSGNVKQLIGKIPGVILSQDGSITLKGKQNVVIYIDGKRTFMSVENLMQWLESMPATDIEKVEVFDTPPAKYDAAGSAGIINVILKKGAALGLNGRIGLNLGYGEFHKVSPSLSVNYRNRKFNAFGGIHAYNNKSFNVYDSEYDLATATSQTHFDTQSKSLSHAKGFGGRAGLDWFLGKKTTVGFLYSGYSGGFLGTPAYNRTKLSGDNTYSYDSIDTKFNNDVYWAGQSLNLNFEHKIKEKEIFVFDVDFVSRGWGFGQDLINNRYEKGALVLPSVLKSNSKTKVGVVVLKADYEKELKKKFSLETGVKTTLVNTKSDNEQFTGDDFNTLFANNSNTFFYNEDVFASYASLSKKWKKWSGDLGIRLEYTYSKGFSPTVDSTVKRNYLNVFPNFSVKRVLSKKTDVSFSYTRRIDRPNYGSLNPFEYQTSQFAFYKGNPFLRPQYSDAFTMGFGIESAVFFTFGYTNTSDAINQIKFKKEGSQDITQTQINVNNIHNFNFNAVVPIPVTKWWTFNFNGNVFYNQQIFEFGGLNVNNSLWSYTLNMQQMFKLPKKFKAELSGYYNSSVFWNTFFVEPHYQLDFGVSKKIKRFDFNLVYQDFLNIRQSFGYNQQDDLRIDYFYTWETRRLKLNIGYRFGNNKIAGSRRRKTASQDAQNRAK